MSPSQSQWRGRHLRTNGGDGICPHLRANGGDVISEPMEGTAYVPISEPMDGTASQNQWEGRHVYSSAIRRSGTAGRALRQYWNGIPCIEKPVNSDGRRVNQFVHSICLHHVAIVPRYHFTYSLTNATSRADGNAELQKRLHSTGKR
jgi:hypothetical protein